MLGKCVTFAIQQSPFTQLCQFYAKVIISLGYLLFIYSIEPDEAILTFKTKFPTDFLRTRTQSGWLENKTIGGICSA